MNDEINKLEKKLNELKIKQQINNVPKPPKEIIKRKKKEWFKTKNVTIVESDNEKIILHTSPFFKVKKFRVTGYILFEQSKNSGNFTLVGLNNFSDVYKTKYYKAYIKHDTLGTLNNKPLLVIKNHLPLSLKTRKVLSTKKDKDGKRYVNGYELCYDPSVLYNTFEYLTFENIKIKSNKEGFDWFNKKVIIGVIILIIIIVVLATPQGRDLLNKLMYDMVYRHYE
jgi:hypothetical protein